MTKIGRPRKNPEIIRRFCKNLNVHLEKPHITQQAIADALEINPQSVSYWSRGGGMPTQRNLVKLAEFLGEDVEKLTS